MLNKTVLILAAVLVGMMLFILVKLSFAAQATLTWTINAPTATETRIERREDPNPIATYAEITRVPAPTATYLDKGLIAGTLYCWRLRSASPSTTSTYSPEVCLFASITGIVVVYTP